MQIKGQAQKVTIYIGESDKWQHKPLYMAILETLKFEDCAGATVTRAVAGFGAHSRIHTASLVALSSDLPLVIEWVDSPARIERVMPRLRQMVSEGLITVQNVEVTAYSHRRLRQLPATLPVQDIMSREVHAVKLDTPLPDIINLLLDKKYRALPVINQTKQVVGIVTQDNLLKTNTLAISVQKQFTQAELNAELQRLRDLKQTVASVMSPDPITISAETTISQAVQLMSKHQVKRLPVVNANKHLVGMLSRVDVLRALCQPPLAESPRQALPPVHQSQVGEIMVTNVPTVSIDAPLTEIMGLLVGNVQRRVVVVDDDRCVAGIITDGDLINRATTPERPGIIQALSQRLLPEQSDTFQFNQRTAAEVMTTPVLIVTPQTSLFEALQLLLTHHIKRLPVVDVDGKLLGLVGRGGILQALAQKSTPSGSPTLE